MRKRIFLSLTFFAASLLPLPALATVVVPDIGVFDNDTPLEYNEIQQLLKAPQPRIKIPGLKLTPAQELPITQSPSGDIYINIPYIGQYIAAIYRYGVVAITILAVVTILVAGIQWMLPGNIALIGEGDQQQRINKAKQVIGGSLVALLIAVGSYTLLYTINPSLVEFKNLRILFIPNVPWHTGNEDVQKESASPDDFKDAKPLPFSVSDLTYQYNNVPYFSQVDGPWSMQAYGNETICTNYKAAGCSPTSIAMVLKFYGHNVTPLDIGRLAVQSGARKCNQGTRISEEFVALLVKTYNLKIRWITKHDEALALLRQGKPVLQSGPQAGFTNQNRLRYYKGHYIVYTGVETRNGVEFIRVNDSGRNAPNSGIVYKTRELFNATRPAFLLLEPQ